MAQTFAHTYGQGTHAHTRTHTCTHTLADRHKSSTNTALTSLFTRTKHILAVRLKVGNTKDTKHDTSTYMHDVLVAVAVGVAFCNFRWLLPWPLVSSVGRGGGVVVVGVKWQHLWLCLSIRQI